MSTLSTLQPPLVTNVNVFFAASISVVQNQELTPDLFTNANQFFQHVLISLRIEPPLLVNVNQFFASEVSGGSKGGTSKGRRGFEPVKKHPRPIEKPEPPKVWTPPQPKPRRPLLRMPEPKLTEPGPLPAELLGMQHEIYSAEDISDVERFLSEYDQDKQDADDIADILAILD